MKILKQILVGTIITNLIVLFAFVIVYFFKFTGGFSTNPEHWYTVGSLIISFLSFLITIIIAVYVSEITKQTTRFPEQRKLYREFLTMNDYVFELLHLDIQYMDFQIRMETIIRRLNVLKGESFIFNDTELYENAVCKYRDKLETISQEVGQKFIDNSSKYNHDNNARLGQIALKDIDDNIRDNFTINEEARFLIDSLKKAMK